LGTVPASQDSQNTAPSSLEKEPSGQVSHSVSGKFEKVPAGQRRQDREFLGAYSPGKHISQSVAFTFGMEPARQEEQEVAPAYEYFPRGQYLQNTDPILFA